jgi:DNA-binding response OmpR family regulator
MTKPVVLVCEDEPLIRFAIVEFLRDVGFDVVEASDAALAQTQLLSGKKIDVVVTDVVMPGELNGIGLAHWVKGRFPHIYVFVCSGWQDGALAQDVKSFDGYFAKPYNFEEVAARINALFPHQAAESESRSG